MRLTGFGLVGHCRATGDTDMRSWLFAVTALVLASCATPPETATEAIRTETVRLEPTGDLVLQAGGYVDVAGFAFHIWFDNDATDLSTPESVTWGIVFNNYCRNRDSWIQSVVVGPEGQVWRGYRVFVPAGPNHPQHWSSGGSGADEFGGPATPGLMEAVARGGRFILAAEDDTGQRWNSVTIDTLTPEARNRLFVAQPASEPRQARMLIEVDAPPVAATRSPRTCP